MIISGLVTMITAAVFIFHVVITFWYPTKYKNQNFYLIKELINCFFLFVCIPLAFIFRNEKMLAYIKNHIKTSQASMIIQGLIYRIIDFYTFVRKKNQNRVTDIPLV
jgi:dolichyl-phosphate-mannose--protein O-mannosyl transferase